MDESVEVDDPPKVEKSKYADKKYNISSEVVDVLVPKKEDRFNLMAFQRLKLNESKLENLTQMILDLTKCWDRSNEFIIRHDKGLQIAAETQAKHFQKLNDLNIRLAALEDLSKVEETPCCCCVQNADIYEKMERIEKKLADAMDLTGQQLMQTAKWMDRVIKLESQTSSFDDKLPYLQGELTANINNQSSRVSQLEYNVDKKHVTVCADIASVKMSVLGVADRINVLMNKCYELEEKLSKRKSEIEIVCAQFNMHIDGEDYVRVERNKELNNLQKKVNLQAKQLILQDEAIRSIYKFLGVEQSVLLVNGNGDTKEVGSYEEVANQFHGEKPIITAEEIKVINDKTWNS